MDDRQRDDRRQRDERLAARRPADMPGSGTVKQRRGIGGRRDEPADVVGQRDRARRDRAGEAGDERRPAAQKRRRRSDTRRAGRRTRRRRAAAAPPARRRPSRRRTPARRRAPTRTESRAHRTPAGDDDRDEENAAADDVGDDDRRGVERTEPAFEGWGGRGVTRAVPASLRDQLPFDGHFADVRPLRRAVLREELDQRIDEMRFCSISPRGSVPV